MTPLEILKQKFGYDSFRFNQEAIITSVLQRKDTFVLMPTGGGKSLCYQIPALMLEGVALVVSPLIALMKDQVDALKVNGIDAAFINSSQDHYTHDMILDDVKQNKIKLLYVAPERLIGPDNNNSFLKRLKNVKVSLIAIDEAHCISQWGHDFRPEYLMLAQLKKIFPDVPVIALTATADKITRQDILDKLELQTPSVFVSSFNRPNIRYVIQEKINSFEKLKDFLAERSGESGIVYCLSRRSTETLAEDLQMAGYKALPYHAGLDRQTRSRHQELFLKDEVKIIIATIAFGMGIDKSNVRFVVHMDVPKNIEGYYQETGRAGRDGLDSIALMFYSFGDVLKLKKFAMIEGNEEQTKISLKKLDEIARFAESKSCRRKFLLNYFDERAPEFCGNCDICLESLEVFDATEVALKALTAVLQLNEKFGMGYVIDVLWGSTSGKLQAEHKTLSCYASGASTSKQQWQTILSGLITQDYLVKTKGVYPLLKLTEKGFAAIQSQTSVQLTRAKLNNESLNFSTAPDAPPLLIQALKDLRRELARAENAPAFVILSDANLLELATYLPLNLNAISKIAGFGEVKVRKYGRQFIELLQNYCNQHGLETKIHLKAAKATKRETYERDNATKQLTLKLYQEGFSVQQIADQRKLSLSTIEGHLAFYIQSGKIKIGDVMNEEKVTVITNVIERMREKTLTPIKLELGDDYSFSEIRYVIAHLDSTKAQEHEFTYGQVKEIEDVSPRIMEMEYA